MSAQRSAVIARTILLVLLAWCAPADCRARAIAEAYARADQLRERTRDKVFKGRVEPHWDKANRRFWYRNVLARGSREFLVVDAVEKTRRPAFDHAKLAEALQRATATPQDPTRLPIDRMTIEEDGTFRLEAAGKPWRYDPRTDVLERGEPLAESPPRERQVERRRRERARRSTTRRTQESPDGHWIAFLREHNILLRDTRSGAEIALSSGGTGADGYEAGVFWSPDSTRLVALRTRSGDDRKVHLIESSPKDQLQPRLHAHDYLKPGDRVPVTHPHLFEVATRKEVALDDDLFPNPWSLGEFHWSPDSSQFMFLYNQRGHQVLRLIVLDATTGKATPLIDEASATFIDYSQKSYVQYLDETAEILWMSERDGWNHLYLVDARTGRVKSQVSKGEWVVRAVDRVDVEARQVWFRASGIHPRQDPYYIHVCRADFEGGGLVVLTEGDGTHEVEFAPDRRYLIDTYSRVDMPPTAELRSAQDGALVCTLERGDWSALLETGWRIPERFAAKGRDGTTDIYGVIFRPSDFDPNREYPVIEQIYAGPQGAFVPKAFAALHHAQSLAELGFVVVQVDGMGTNWRSKAFHDVSFQNLGDAGLPDRILWMKAAARKDPALDLTRVGIYGGSAGGQNALGALLFHPEFYKVGVADCGCHDNRMDKIWWNEAWMGWPIGPHYAAQSNVTQAHRLKGRLLLMVGELDRNVDPASTMQVVNALIAAGKDFDLVVFPGAGHGAGGSRYGERRRRDFFVKHLLKVDPPERNANAETAVNGDRAVSRASSPSAGEATVIGALDLAREGMRPVIERFTADDRSLRRMFPPSSSPAQLARERRFARDWLDTLAALDFDSFDQAGRIDYILLKNHLEHARRDVDFREKAATEVSPLLPFSSTIVGLEAARRRMEWTAPETAGDLLNGLATRIKETRRSVEAGLKPSGKDETGRDDSAKPTGSVRASKSVAFRAAHEVRGLRATLREWYGFSDGYDPLFTWWAAEPYKAADKALEDYAAFLRERLAGVKADDEEAIVGNPIGRDALLAELSAAMIPYSPEELIAIADKEFAWCETEMKRAARAMGLGDDAKTALERVKAMHVAPGRQPALIRDLAAEAIQFLDEHELVSIPPLARESWRMEMMSPRRQLVNPFFTGGEVISVSYPTSAMTHEQKMMTMRGNNVPFARATVHHELIPGHHLQAFMAARHRSYRHPFETPFLVEGWALHWELLLWDLKFPRTPEERVGMLFWRMHRCARIRFSLAFHLGKMTPQECIDYLVERVGHEPDNAKAEVRRSFGGHYDPLYQAAYMLGGLQLRALRTELVAAGKMTDRVFHDAVLRENAIPIELIRASLTSQPLARDFSTRWRFHDPVRNDPREADGGKRDE